MNIEQIKEKLKSGEYDFLKTDPYLGNNPTLYTGGQTNDYSR